MNPILSPATPETGTPLDGLLAVAAALRTGPDLTKTLDAVAGSIAATLRVNTTTINLYRPAFNDFETVAVHGSDAARKALLGSRSPAEEWAQLIDERFERRGAYFIADGQFDWEGGATLSYVPPIPASDDPHAWRAEDALFVPLRSSSGALLGVLSVDEPVSGKRPSEHDLDVLVGVAGQAGLAIESAQHAKAASRHRADVQQLLRVSSRLTSERSREGIATVACEGVRDALGFERVALILRDPGCDRLRAAAAVNWAEGRRPTAPRPSSASCWPTRTPSTAASCSTARPRTPAHQSTSTASTPRAATAAGRTPGTTTGCSSRCATRPGA